MHVIAFVVFVLALDPSAGCLFGDAPPPNRPPSISCPKMRSEFTADKGANSVKVTWPEPTVTDPEDNAGRVSILTGRGSGAVFEEGPHTVVFQAMDEGGLSAVCVIQFKVVVVKCRRPRRPDLGSMKCGELNYGSFCDFDCKSGYILNGPSTITCEQNGKWSSEPPNCAAATCPPYELPDNALSLKCTDSWYYKSVCWLICNEKKGFAPVIGQWTECTADKLWTNYRLRCEDVQGPVIGNCPADTIHQTKDPSSELTVVVWPKITVRDNFDKNVVLEKNKDVSSSKGTFKVGVELIEFTAVDRQGNKAKPCTFLVKVQALKCRPPHFPHDKYLRTPGCTSFKEGDECQLTCFLDLELDTAGPDYIQCLRNDSTNKGYWDWGQGANNTIPEPRCKVHKCKKLREPNNGAMACDTYTKGSQCTINCRSTHDIPESAPYVSGLYLCGLDTGKWIPEKVPNCEKREEGKAYRMPVQYYFSGPCKNATKEIAENFIEAIKKRDLCLSVQNCHFGNVEVRCGDEVDHWALRRKRRAKPQYISFDIISKSPANTEQFSTLWISSSKRLRAIAKDIVRTSFEANGRRINATKASAPRRTIIICREGSQIGFFHRDSCVPCPEGSYHNITSDECIACPYGKYQENKGQTTCDSCDYGYTTLTVATSNATSCKEMCLPGYYSNNGITPCEKCPRASYQEQMGQKDCWECPSGFTTEDEGSNSSAQCIPYDLILQGPVVVPMEGRVPYHVCDFTFAVWIKILDNKYGGVSFLIESSVTSSGIEVAISSDISVFLGSSEVHLADVITETWMHVAVTWSNNELVVFTDGKIILTEQLANIEPCQIAAYSSLKIQIRDHAYMYLRDLNFLRSSQPESIGKMAQTCDSYFKESLFSLETMDFLSLDRVNDVTPSTCLKPDICASNPCGDDDVCIPDREGYSCLCRAGYTGQNCEIPPDYCGASHLCRNNATCVSSGRDYTCVCGPGFRGELCHEEIADGAWSQWMEWRACSVSCGNGTRTRHRFCTNPPPDRGGRPCPGDARDTRPCNLAECPDCNEATLMLGKGITTKCSRNGKSITCSPRCLLGKVFPQKPFDYKCMEGVWTPTSLTVSCTDPVTPVDVGVNYTVVFDNTVRSHQQVASHLQQIGSGLGCVQTGTCSIVVGSSVCTERIGLCEAHSGNYYGSLIVKRPVPAGTIDVKKIQSNQKVMTYLYPLFSTWNMLTHNSEETERRTHRELELDIRQNKMFVVPYEKPNLSFEITGQFGTILKLWKHMDDTNWEVRTKNYTDFNMVLGQKGIIEEPAFLLATQTMTCPEGAVRGGLFCFKCPPGKYYMDNLCHVCRHGFYQDDLGQMSCKPCPGFETTKLLGSPAKEQCAGNKLEEILIFMSLGKQSLGILQAESLQLNTIDLATARGNTELVVYNPYDGYIYYTLQPAQFSEVPASIGRVRPDGTGEQVVIDFTPDTFLTGLDVDAASSLVFYTTFSGQLACVHVSSGAVYVLLSNLTRPKDLVLDQNFGVYWVENNKIMYVKYNSKIASTIVTEQYVVDNPVLVKQDKIVWQSYRRLRSAFKNGLKPQTLASNFTSRYGLTDDYFFYLDKDGKVMRVNKDLQARVDILSLPSSVLRIRLSNVTRDPSLSVGCCDEVKNYCDQGCFPLNVTSRKCFCSQAYTLQQDYKSCRRDFSVTITTDRADKFWIPKSSDYTVPPGLYLKVKVKACHSARVILAKNRIRNYLIDLDRKRGAVTEMSIRRYREGFPIVNLQRKQLQLLDCDSYKTFWFSWSKRTIRVGAGDVVGKNQLLQAADELFSTVNYVMFGSGINSTAVWYF